VIALQRRHAVEALRMWGEFWTARGVLAPMPDSFGPHGKAYGFDRFTHVDPDREDVNEKTARSLDAEGGASVPARCAKLESTCRAPNCT
jgi:carboxymethylenebutenolidase